MKEHMESANSLPKQLGDFEILDELGRGGMGIVYVARQKSLNRRVALKVLASSLGLTAKAVMRFRREAEAAAKLHHTNTLTLFDFGSTHDNQLFLVTEFVPGKTLWTEVKSNGAMSPPRAARVARQMLLSLREAHGMGIIHRDLKPNNIMLFDTPHEKDVVKLLDFGIAKLTDTLMESAEGKYGELTSQGQLVGTPRYMPPEVLIQASPISPSSGGKVPRPPRSRSLSTRSSSSLAA